MEKWAAFLFHRDCRLDDHVGLSELQATGMPILPIFIFDPQQLESHPYRSLNGLNFLLDSLEDLEGQIRSQGGQLLVLKGPTLSIIEKLIDTGKIHTLGSSEDVTPFAIQRDLELKSLCQSHGIKFISAESLFLHHPKTVHKDDGKPYTIFTPFFRKASVLAQRPLHKTCKGPWVQNPMKLLKDWQVELQALRPTNHIALARGGRKQGLALLKNLPSKVQYTTQRDIPSLTSTSSLSAHLKFGTLSPWEVIHFLKKDPDHPIVRQLYWRDFFYHIAYHYPRVFSENFQIQTQGISWENSKTKFKAWCEGKTGFPIVDAAMRELVSTGNMHNRARMITASFLVKDLHIDWRWGERFFAQHLTDYDPALNNGNWQWAASTGCDAQPYFRIFNPWLQQKKFDGQAAYIKKWITELREIDASFLHRLNIKHDLQSYPKPIVEHSHVANMAKSLFAEAKHER